MTLDINWPALLVDEDSGQCLTKLPRAEQGTEYETAVATALKVIGPDWKKRATDYTLLLANALGRANEIFIAARLDETRSGAVALSKDEFLREFRITGSKEDFLVFMENRIEERYRNGSIKQTTWKNHRSTLNKLRESQKKTPFNSLNYKFADDFEAWLKRNKHGEINTRWQRHKETKTYLAEACKARIGFEDPYKYFKVQTAESSWKPMTLAELSALEAYYPPWKLTIRCVRRARPTAASFRSSSSAATVRCASVICQLSSTPSLPTASCASKRKKARIRAERNYSCRSPAKHCATSPRPKRKTKPLASSTTPTNTKTVSSNR